MPEPLLDCVSSRWNKFEDRIGASELRDNNPLICLSENQLLNLSVMSVASTHNVQFFLENIREKLDALFEARVKMVVSVNEDHDPCPYE